MSIYVRVKELWAFGVAHKLAVIIMILASPANCRKKGPASRVRPTSQARPRPDISIQASTFLKTRRDATHGLPCLPAPPISPNFLAKLGKPRIDAAIFLPSDSDLTEIITRQRRRRTLCTRQWSFPIPPSFLNLTETHCSVAPRRVHIKCHHLSYHCGPSRRPHSSHIKMDRK